MALLGAAAFIIVLALAVRYLPVGEVLPEEVESE